MDEKLIIGTWKMNGSTELVDEFTSLFDKKNIILGLPNILIAYARFKSKYLQIAAQDCSIFSGFGAHTGEVSCQMLVATGVKYVILGHSERRLFSKLDSIDNVFQKLSNTIEADMTAILCVDEGY
jgi:triosephosphate isomerase